nr:aminodeoxychorismate/anthranilate synthase component II [Planctopirus hydrillae]
MATIDRPSTTPDKCHMLLIIDNYDSFVQNVARYLVELGQSVRVVRNDLLSIQQIIELAPSAIVISPGPCSPTEAGISLEVIKQLSGQIPILGICLGHQAIGAAFGGKVVRAHRPLHGESSSVTHQGHALFHGLPETFQAGRYHSLVIDHHDLPDELEPLAWTLDAPHDIPVLMAVGHRTHATFGVQFHPESILTQGGHRLLSNFLNLAKLPSSNHPAESKVESHPPETGNSVAGRAAVFW